MENLPVQPGARVSLHYLRSRFALIPRLPLRLRSGLRLTGMTSGERSSRSAIHSLGFRSEFAAEVRVGDRN